MKRHSQSGVALIEVLFGVALVTLIAATVAFSIITYVSARDSLLSDMTAVYLAEEGYELMRGLRNDNWTSFEALAVDTPIYLDVATTSIAVSGTPEVINGIYTREIFLREVYRDSNDDITASTTVGATVDGGSREVEVSVGSPNGTTTFSGILTNVFAL